MKKAIHKNGYLKEAKNILESAKEEFKLAKEKRSKLKTRQSAEKGYLALKNIVYALFVKKGVKEEELPKVDRGIKYMLGKYADREFRKKYDRIKHTLHIDTFYEGVVIYPDIEDCFTDLEELLISIE